ncbi:MAG: hypothetical protein OHK0056_07310 [Bacteriovoracaceae bacterium]
MAFNFLFLACSTKKVDEAPKVAPITVNAKPVWFNAPERFRYVNQQYDIETHAFFDLAPLEDKNKYELNYFLLTPIDSEFGYDFNLKSGQPFKRFHYCAQNDVWKTYPGKIEYPPYAEGIVPRVLDQFSRPMRVLVFGNPAYFVTEKRDQAYSQRTRIIGGVVQQFCPNYPCSGREKWTSTMVMVGVVPFDPEMKDVTNIEQLKKKTNWGLVKAFMENGHGRKLGPPRDEPVYRIISEVDAESAWKFSFEKGHVFDIKEMNSIRSSCYRLYDAIWFGAKKSRAATEKKVMTKAELQKRAEEIIEMKNDMSRMTVIRDTYRDRDEEKLSELEKVEKRELKFGDFFKYIYFEYGKRLHTCFEYVRPANIRLDSERHWFFTYLEAFIKLDFLGHHYLCSRKAWVENPLLTNGRRSYSSQSYRNCTGEELDLAFDGAITFLTGLGRSDREHYRYVEYDSGIGGSHKRIYSWVFDDGKKLRCPSDFKTATPLGYFPSDIRWNNYYKASESDENGYIQ